MSTDGGVQGGGPDPAVAPPPGAPGGAGGEADLRMALGATMAKLTEMMAEMKSLWLLWG